MPARRRYVLASGLAVLAISAALAIFSGQDGAGTSFARLVVQTDPVGFKLPAADRTGTFYLGSLCIKGPGEARIIGVKPAASRGGGDISDFSVFPFSQLGSQPGADDKHLKDLAQFRGGNKVTEQCRSGAFTQTSLALELTAQGEHDFTVDGVVVEYRSGGEIATVEAPFTLEICGARTACD